MTYNVFSGTLNPTHFTLAKVNYVHIHVCYMLSPVHMSVCRLSVTLVHPTQPVEIFGNVPTPFGTLVIH